MKTLLVVLAISLFFSLSIIVTYYFPSYQIVEGRCPNGTHKSPSGDCETVVSHGKLSRCPNGYHRSPDGDCERVSDGGSSSSSKSDNSGSASGSDNNSPFTTGTKNNNNAIESPSSTTSLTTSTSNECDQSLWNHVYNPARLEVVEPCKTVSGTIDSIRIERDGDFHVRLKLDPQFSNLINSANIDGQFGDLVVEPICMNPVTQADAISACQNFRQNISIPSVGTHVNVTGSYVLDKQHGGWAEIHPVTSIISIR